MTPVIRAACAAALTTVSISLVWAGQIDLSIVDAATRRPVPARVLIADSNGKSYAPEEAAPVPIGPDRWFVSDGTVHLTVPARVAFIRVERGTEYRPFTGTVDVPGKRTVQLQRWIDMRARGYYSGEDHVHVDVSALPAMLAAEDLNFGNSLYWWNGPNLNLPPGEENIRPLVFAGQVMPSSVFDAEVEHSWGAVYLIGLQKPMSIPSDKGRSNLPFVKDGRRQGALIAYQGGYSREVLLDALLGYVDVVNICNNNFHRYKYQPRPQYSNMLEVAGLDTYPATAEGMMQMNTDTYYRLLNCGLHLAAGAESATGAKTTPVGYNRAYVYAGRNPSLVQFLEAWRRGRNFVTNGPMIFLTANGNTEPGDTIALPKTGGKVRLKATAISDQPLQSLEIVVNGKVAARTKTGELTALLNVKEGAWIAARATAEDRLLSDIELNRYLDRTGRLGGEAPTRLRFGHTSPIYCTTGGVGARVPASVEEAKRILSAFEIYARKNADPKYLAEILNELPRAMHKLEP